MKFEISVEATICSEVCTDDEVSEIAEGVMEALVDLGVEDPFVGGSIRTRRFEIALVLDVATDAEAFERGNQLISEALREAGVELAPASADAPLAWSQKSVRPAAAV